MTLTGYFTLKSVFGQQDCRTLTFALARLSCCHCHPFCRLLIAICHPRWSVRPFRSCPLPRYATDWASRFKNIQQYPISNTWNNKLSVFRYWHNELNAGLYSNGAVFTGILAYADDIVLLAPTPQAMRRMLVTCEDYAAEFSILFNASKSKCIICIPRPRSRLHDFINDVKFTLNGNVVETVKSYPHLGDLGT